MADGAIIKVPGRFTENKLMKPMVITSTPFISYSKIQVKDTDLYEDAWGLNTEFNDVIETLRQIRTIPGKKLTEKLIERIRKEN
jgi:hypothetical protein